MPASHLITQQRRAEKARGAALVTCPASRHLHMLADYLAIRAVPRQISEEPQYVAVSIYAILADLWEARAREKKRR